MSDETEKTLGQFLIDSASAAGMQPGGLLALPTLESQSSYLRKVLSNMKDDSPGYEAMKILLELVNEGTCIERFHLQTPLAKAQHSLRKNTMLDAVTHENSSAAQPTLREALNALNLPDGLRPEDWLSKSFEEQEALIYWRHHNSLAEAILFQPLKAILNTRTAIVETDLAQPSPLPSNYMDMTLGDVLDTLPIPDAFQKHAVLAAPTREAQEALVNYARLEFLGIDSVIYFKPLLDILESGRTITERDYDQPCGLHGTTYDLGYFGTTIAGDADEIESFTLTLKPHLQNSLNTLIKNYGIKTKPQEIQSKLVKETNDFLQKYGLECTLVIDGMQTICYPNTPIRREALIEILTTIEQDEKKRQMEGWEQLADIFTQPDYSNGHPSNSSFTRKAADIASLETAKDPANSYPTKTSLTWKAAGIATLAAGAFALKACPGDTHPTPQEPEPKTTPKPATKAYEAKGDWVSYTAESVNTKKTALSM